jgi:hypothetical protein
MTTKELSLGRDEPNAVDNKLVLFCLTPEDGMIFEDEAAPSLCSGLFEQIRRAEAAQAGPDYDKIIPLSAVGSL